jgi:hypothetical protein
MELNVEYGDFLLKSEIWRLKKPLNIVTYLWLLGENLPEQENTES